VSTRSIWRVGRPASAVVLALVAGLPIAAMFADWHVLREHAIDGKKVFEALYVGPDYRVSDDARARMLDEGMNAGVTETVCTGLDHLGLATPIALAVVVLLALICVLVPSRIAAFAGLAAALAAFLLAGSAALMRHLLVEVGPDSSAAIAFDVLRVVVVGAAVLVCVCVVKERRQLLLSRARQRKLVELVDQRAARDPE
jgi:hypothetical protein